MIARAQAAAPSLNADADAKRFAPDPGAPTVYGVRRHGSDGRNFVEVQMVDGPAGEALPDTMVLAKLEPGAHSVA